MLNKLDLALVAVNNRGIVFVIKEGTVQTPFCIIFLFKSTFFFTD